MKYNILVIRNRYTKNPNFTKWIEWFKTNTPLEIVMTDHIDTSFEVTTKQVGNATFSGVVCGDDIFEKLRTIVPQGKYHAVVFLYGNDLAGIRVNISDPRSLFPGTYLIQLFQDGDGGKALNHEIFHTFFHRLRAQGINLTDPMDSVVYNGQVIPYFQDQDPDAVPSNRSIAKASLAPFWDKITTITPTTVITPLPVDTYKWFKMTEKTGSLHTFGDLDSKLRSILDTARDKAGVPFVLTSGYRTISENAAVGGVVNSSHIKRLAADILCTDGIKLSAIIRGILTCGTPVFLEIANKHVHIDIDSSIHPMGMTIINSSDD